MDIGVLRYLNEQGFEGCCKFHGIFADGPSTYVVMSFAGIELFSWASRQAAPLAPDGLLEARMRPVAVQLFAAVRSLHDLGIAHRDLSMENVMVQEDVEGRPIVRLVDFAQATCRRFCPGQPRGKLPYVAPEIWQVPGILQEHFFGSSHLQRIGI